MPQSDSKNVPALARHGINLALAAGAFKLVQQFVPAAYLDEVFHIPQAQEYCKGNFHSWDPKITTPPGLYIIGYIHSNIFRLFNSDSETFCSVKTLRHANLVGLIAFLPLSILLIKKSASLAAALTAFPLLAFFAFLFYTDVWSTIFVLSSIAIGVHFDSAIWSNVLSAVFAAISITFRQTNIIWAGFVAVYLLHPKKLTTRDNITEDVLQFLQRVVTTPSITVPYGLIAVVFIGFIEYNGGIALGDKDNHVVGLNIPQLFYASLFFLFFSWPLWLSPRFILRYLRSNFLSPTGILKYAVGCIIIAVIIENLTIVHPFILADNRHYTFYIWRRLISPSYHEYAKFLMVPVYHLGIWAFIITLYYSSSASFILSTTLLGAIIATLVPSPLFESRYYILPYVIWRLLQGKIRWEREWLEWIWYTLINLVTFYIFLTHEFQWPGHGNESMRFLW